MATTINLLSDQQGFYTKSASSGVNYLLGAITQPWTATNSTVELISTEFLTTDRYVLRIAPNTTSDIVLTLSSVELYKKDNGKTLSFNCQIKPPTQVNITTVLSIDGETTPDGYQQTIPGSVYGAVHSNTVVVPTGEDIHYASISITISGHENNNIYFSVPNLIDDLGFYKNYFVAAARNLMPDFFWQIDSVQQYPTAPFHRLMDVLTTEANESRVELLEIFPYELWETNGLQIEDGSAWHHSTLVNPQYARPEYIPWLSQFIGNRIVNNVTDGNGNLHFIDKNRARSFVEWQLLESSYGRASGTRQSLINSVKQVLGSTKDFSDSTYSVSLTANYNDDPWSILIQTLENETPDASVGDSSILVLSAVEPARPLGYKIYHNTVSDFFFTLNDITYGVLDEFPLGEVSLPTGAPVVTSASVSANAAVLEFLPLSSTGEDGGGVISNYQYALSTDGGSSYGAFQTLSPAKGSPPITITGLSSSQLYYVKLKAINDAGTSTIQSTPFSFTTL